MYKNTLNTSLSPNQLPLPQYTSIGRDKPRISTFSNQQFKLDEASSPQPKSVYSSQYTEIDCLKKQISELEQQVSQQNKTITQLLTELDKVKEIYQELSDKKQKNGNLNSPSVLTEKKISDDHKKFKQELTQLNHKFSEMKVDYETKQMSLEEKVRSIQLSFESRMKIFFDTQIEFEDIYNSINQLANELSLLKSQQNQDNQQQQSYTETYHIDQNGFLMDQHNNYLLNEGQMIKLNEKQISYLKENHKLA